MDRRQFVAAWTGMGVLGASLKMATPFRRRGLGATAPRLDAHAHIMSPALAEMITKRMGSRDFTAKDGAAIVAELDRDGIERAIVLSTAYIFAADVWSRTGTGWDVEAEHKKVRDDNDYVAAQTAKFSGRLIPFVGVNPKRPYAVEEIDRAIDTLGMRGIKLHFWNSDVRLREPEQVEQIRPVFARAAAKRVPIVAHIFNGGVKEFGAPDIEILIRQLVAPFPELRISIAHLAGAGGSGPGAARCFAALTDLVKRDPALAQRVYTDCSAVFLSRPFGPMVATTEDQKKTFAPLLKKWDAGHLLWGSDNIPHAMEQTHEAWPLTEDDWAVLARQDGAGLLAQ
jgi:predicted TIM-barrel fold metal-dependent hydrolase